MTISELEMRWQSLENAIKESEENLKCIRKLNRGRALRTRLNRVKEDAIIEACALVFNVTAKEVLKRSRRFERVDSRHVAMEIIKKTCTTTSRDISKRFHCKEHSTVNYAIKRVKDLLSVDPEFKSKYNSVIELLETKQ